MTKLAVQEVHTSQSEHCSALWQEQCCLWAFQSASSRLGLLGTAWVGVNNLPHCVMAVGRVDAEAVALAA